MAALSIRSIARTESRLGFAFRGALSSHIRQLRCARSDAKDFVGSAGAAGHFDPQCHCAPVIEMRGVLKKLRAGDNRRKAAGWAVLSGWSAPWASAKLTFDFRWAKEAKRVKLIAAYIMAMFAMAATVANGQQAPAPTTNPEDNAASAAPVADAASAAPVAGAAGTMPVPGAASTTPVADAYVIGPGDTLQVFVWRNPDLSATIPVRPDGKISTPLVEDMIAVGKTPSQLARAIEKVLSDYVRSPQVNVIVTQPVSALSQVKVIGQVTKPQAVPYREGLTVLDVVLSVGGMTQFAAGNRAKIMRMQGGKQSEIKVKLANLINGDLTQNILMKPGDVLVIPQTFF